jgi:hypothetical protein
MARPEAAVLVVEGEPAADAAAALLTEYVAITSAGGAQAAARSDWSPLRGRHVVVWPDSDNAGEQYAVDVARLVRGVGAADVRIVQLPSGQPVGWDLADPLPDGWNQDTIRELVGSAHPVTDPAPAARRAVLVPFSDVQAEPVKWLWGPYIPRGKLTLLEGDPAAGKTWLALAIAAAVSRGRGFPHPEDGHPSAATSEPEDVIYLTAEDGLADTLRPRLDAMGADCARVHALTALRERDNETAVTLRDVDVLNDALTRTRAALLVVDPLQGFLGAQVDMHRANEVRPVLAGLAKLAERHGCAVLCIRHLSKANAERPIYRGLGSIDFTATARSVLLVGRDPNDSNRRALVQLKNSLAPEGPALAYVIEGSSFEWVGLSNLTAGSLLAPDSAGSERRARDGATEFLTSLLANGPVEAKEVQRHARAAGIAAATLRRAKDALGVRSRKRSGDGPWEWNLTKVTNMLTSECEHLERLGADEGFFP